MYGSTALTDRVATVAFNVRGMPPEQVARRLNESGVFVGAGHFYATMCNEALGLLPSGVVRASASYYTSPEDIDRLLRAVADIAGSAAKPSVPQ